MDSLKSPQQLAIVAILETGDVLRRRFAAVMEPTGITLQQFNVLRVIHEAGGDPIPTLEIAARLIEQTPGITRLLDRLDERGLVHRERSAADRRIVLCGLTPAGAALVAQVAPSIDAIDHASLAGFEPDEIDAFLEMLEAIRTA
jgi:DNA-binding MarR family transcriptional regulator